MAAISILSINNAKKVPSPDILYQDNDFLPFIYGFFCNGFPSDYDGYFQ